MTQTSLSVEQDKIISRVRKLLKLAADRGATEAEAQLAAEKAREMLAEYGLSIATVEMRGDHATEQRTMERADLPAREKWHPKLMEAVAKVSFVRARLKHKSTSDRRKSYGAGFELVGRVAAVASAKVLYEYLCDAVNRAGSEYAKTPIGMVHGDVRYFKRGMAERLAERLEERHEMYLEEQARQVREQQAATRHPSSAGNALVPVMTDWVQREKDLNQDLAYGQPPGTATARRAEREAEELREQQKYDAKVQRLTAEGMRGDVAQWVAKGFSRQRAEELCAPEPPETEAQASRRRERERRQEQRENAYWDRIARKEGSPGWRAGRVKGNEVGLDKQVDRNSGGKLT